jgi:Ca-activated chloride channel family protein
MSIFRALLSLTAAVLIGAPAGLCAADQIELGVDPVRGVLSADTKQTTWIRVSLNGFRLAGQEKRPPVNLAIVLDKSGSMQGEKIEQARRAAIDALSLLGPDDIVSVITYDSTVNVLVPSTKLTEPDTVAKAIRGIQAGGNTALFAGVSKGAAEVRKFLDRERVNRVILLSDGLANVGPSSPGELGALGASLLKENISVSTLGLGLGYNEDLMVQLAGKSGGNHQFIEEASELADVFRREFDDVLSVVAQKIDVKITIPEGIRPVRVLGNESDINGQQVVTRLAQIYSEQNKHVVIEVEIPKSEAGSKLKLATVAVSYTNMKTLETDQLSGTTEVKFSSSESDVEGSLNRHVLADVVALVSSEQSKLATKYLDEGDLMKCREILDSNGAFLKTNALLCPKDDRLRQLSVVNDFQLNTLSGVTSNKDERANSYRKSQRASSFSLDQQMELPSVKSATDSATPRK